jgi:hypothetical protein
MFRLVVENATGNKFSVQEIRALQKRLKAIEPSLRTEFVREIKSIGKSPEQAIQNKIPLDAPLSGMSKPNSKLQWGKVTKAGGKSKGARSTTIRFRTQAGGKSLTSTLLAIRVNSAATSVADMAGRSGRSVGKGYRNSGYSKPIVRTYADGSQSVEFRRRATAKAGEAFIRNLNSALGNRASRMAWKAVEKDLPKLSKDVQFVVNKWAIRASRGF